MSSECAELRGPNFATDGLNDAADVFCVDLGRVCAGPTVRGATANSVGQGAELRVIGRETTAANLLIVSAGELPALSFGMMLAAMDGGFVANSGGSLGDLCIN